MERKLTILLAVLFLSIGSVSADANYVVKPVSAVSNTTQTINNTQAASQTPSNISPTVPQLITFDKCTKKYSVSVDDLYFLTLASINANKFRIDEIQSRNGYILFTAAGRQYLASVNKVDTKAAILKITPADNNYYFPLGILTNIYKYIDLNLTTKIENLG